MEIVHVEKDGNFTWMKNIHLRDRFLSLKAKGLMSVMFSLPKDWDCTITGLAYISKEGISAIRATIKELEAAGYITRERIRNGAGQLKDMKYTIHETPVNREPEEPVPADEPTVPDNAGSEMSQDEPDLSALPEPASEKPAYGFPTQGSPAQDQPVEQNRTQLNTDMRTLPLVPDFRDLLLRKKEEQAHYRRLCGRSYCTDYLDYVCVNELGERLKPNTLSSGFKRILETNGMRIIRLHDLRHSCASLLLANGVPMKQIQEWLGHSDFSTTANIYAHLDYHSKLSSADAMLNGLGMTSHHNDLSLPAHEKKPCNPWLNSDKEVILIFTVG